MNTIPAIALALAGVATADAAEVRGKFDVAVSPSPRQPRRRTTRAAACC
ncbi:hypothetical protein IP92_01150 [Pseudoduganella flava]|uniref:Uncharacterized protein n=1 Tax=Pseudoduganella flava TaxID=871742 RepID=A0A562Q0T1_9BURK|nr:hypothetical protein [Pseudoduganella flava]QGZ38517.1 hypothetical protein GO485_05240 [Pseudoduganella flava]TWI49926.1 hypothetical protein IP92_01150 [Pseudoduganella flava]